MDAPSLEIFSGPPVYLRPFDREHIPTLLPWFYEDPDILRYLSWQLPLNGPTREERWLEQMLASTDQFAFAIHDFETGAHIGQIGLHAIEHVQSKGELGVFLAPGWREQGRGRAALRKLLTWAFAVYNLHRVQLSVWSYNERAKRTYAAVGFTREGVLREGHFFAGRYWDEEIWGILAGEFLATEDTTPSPTS